ncbi:MAG TPA: hypothetical protein VFH33_05935, partial [Candidatus Krumholzibacteria bacterium]|nr:hypothetical protein [Candidatus Krumholzibacteria bacterium]
GGPFALRFIMQPVVATLLGIRAGRKDARQNKPLYFWSIFKAGDMYDRRAILRDGWGDVWKAFSVAIGLDVIYEIVAFRWVYPIQAIIIATVLALIPYLIFRGIANRIASKRRKAS